MSQKITPKNLHYDNSLPPFLARLGGQQAAHSGPDPILASHRRPGQKRSASEEAEDAPVVVDEHGNVIALKDALLEGEDDDAKTGEESQGANGKDLQTKEEENGDAGRENEKIAAAAATIGGSRKRKVGRVIGEQHSEDESGKPRSRQKKNSKADDDEAIAKASEDVRRLIGQGGRDIPDQSANGSSTAKTSAEKSKDASLLQQKTVKSAKKKTAKKIKLSFGDDDGE